MPNHALCRTHAYVEINPNCCLLTTDIILSSLPAAMSANRLAIHSHIEKWTVRYGPDRRNHPGIIDVIVF
jgi:hypothetical protein